MKFIPYLFIFFGVFSACSQKNEPVKVQLTDTIWKQKLSPEAYYVLREKGTEKPYSGKFLFHKENGYYTCAGCGNRLFESNAKFDSHCGWPSFDDEIKGAVKKTPDADGRRTEITCANCGGHLGHVFYGEGLTPKDTRHCVNSISMLFVENKNEKKQTATAVFAGGCFWGVEYYFQNAKGVLSTQVGYTGGFTQNPTYKEVCAHKTGHIEALEVTYDPTLTNYEALAKLFFEIHDPTQTNGQGNDIGEQYLSIVFYLDEEQKSTTEKLIGQLQLKGYKVATKLKKATKFWPAEEYHQQYYEKGGGTPYCHHRVSRF